MTLLHLLEQYPIALIFACGFFGLLTGSFLNVVIYRLPIIVERNWHIESCHFLQHPIDEAYAQPFNLVVPRSACTHCKTPIAAWHNIPLFSFLFLRGKCAHCQTPISWRYPTIELLTAILSAIVAYHFGYSWQMLAALLYTWTFLALIFIDLEHMILPDNVTIPMVWLGLLLNINHTFCSLNNAVIGALAGYLSLWTLMWTYKFITGKQGMGHGDFKLFAVIGAWLGWQVLPFTLMAASIVGAVVGITYLSISQQGRDTAIPFGPFLATAGWFALCWGSSITTSYLQMIGLR